MHTLKEIKGDDSKVTSVILHDIEKDSDYEEQFDAVFVFIGANPQTSLVPFVECDEDGYIKTDNVMRSSIPGLYAVGDVRNGPFKQIITAASDGSIAAHFASEYIDELKGQSYE